MTALDVAHGYGLTLRRKGSREFACCPLHGEKTPSLCFFPDGRWYCFGCHAHGDAADLYAALYNVPIGEALRAVGASAKPPPRRMTALELMNRAEAWKAEKWAEACARKHTANALTELLAEHKPDSDVFWSAVKRKADAEDELNLLDSANPAQLLRMIAEASASEQTRRI